MVNARSQQAPALWEYFNRRDMFEGIWGWIYGFMEGMKIDACTLINTLYKIQTKNWKSYISLICTTLSLNISLIFTTLWTWEKITWTFRSQSSDHLWTRLNRKHLTIARLCLGFSSIVASKSDPNLVASLFKLFSLKSLHVYRINRLLNCRIIEVGKHCHEFAIIQN